MVGVQRFFDYPKFPEKVAKIYKEANRRFLRRISGRVDKNYADLFLRENNPQRIRAHLSFT